MGAGVQGLAEAPWLDLRTQAATNGWWARDSSALPAVADDTGPPGADKWWEPGATPARAAKPGTGPFAMGPASGQSRPGPIRGGAVRTRRVRNGAVRRTAAARGGLAHACRAPRGRRPIPGDPGAVPAALAVQPAACLDRADLGAWRGARASAAGGLTTGRYAQVPSVTGDSVATATAALKANGFTVSGETPVHSNVVPKGTVVGTNPAGRAAKGSTIALLVSAGPFTSTVPVVKNDTLAQAQAALARAHLIGREQQVGSTAPVGTVLGTNPVAGTSWPQTKPVAILVAASMPLPNFFGHERADGGAVGERARRGPADPADLEQHRGTGHDRRPAARRRARPTTRARPSPSTCRPVPLRSPSPT